MSHDLSRHNRKLTILFMVFVLLTSMDLVLSAKAPLLDGGDGFNAILPFQFIGIHELTHLNFFWTDRLGLGYPLLNELNFQIFNPLNSLYLFLEPITAYHIQMIAWIALIFLSSWLCFPRIFPNLS